MNLRVFFTSFLSNLDVLCIHSLTDLALPFRCSSSQGTCTIYDNKQLAMSTGSLVLGLNIVITALISLACVAEKRRLANGNLGGLVVQNGGHEVEGKENIDTEL